MGLKYKFWQNQSVWDGTMTVVMFTDWTGIVLVKVLGKTVGTTRFLDKMNSLIDTETISLIKMDLP